jgi:D-amino peptidase
VRIFICADIEGIAGVVSREHQFPEGLEWQSARIWMTDSVAAAAEAAFEAGATEVVVADSHGQAHNLLLDRLRPEIQVVRGHPRPLSMMQGIDEGPYDGCFFVGHHSGGMYPRGILAHTFRSSSLREIRLNGVAVPEATINAALAGHFGVPVLLVTGDDACIEETQAILPGIEPLVVKTAYSLRSARTMTPAASYPLIKAAAASALARRAEIKPFIMEGPITLDVSYLYRQPVEYAAMLDGVERLDAFTIRTIHDDVVKMQRFLVFLLGYASTLQ